MKCPECGGELVMHTAGEKAGRGHCNACGVCWPAVKKLEVLASEDSPKPVRRTRRKAN